MQCFYIGKRRVLIRGDEMIAEIKAVSFFYEENREILDSISFSIKKGQIICILGPNGVGKTTLLNCIANLITPTKGEIILEGKAIREMTPKEIAANIGFVPQLIVPTFSYEVLSYVVTGCAPRIGTFEKPKKKHYEIAQGAIAEMGITHIAHKYYTNISGGERQLASIARALTQKPKIILMDEPTAHLDYGNQIKVLKIIKKLANDGYSAVITTHNPDHALLLGGKVVALAQDRSFVFGDSRQVITKEFLSALYGTDLHLYHISDIGRDVCIVPKI